MANWPALRSLTFNDIPMPGFELQTNPLFPDHTLTSLISLPFLRNLEISDDLYGCSLPIFTSAKLPSLRSLSYTFDPSAYKGHPFDAIVAAYSHLTELTLIVLSCSRDRHLSDFLSHLASLQQLRVVNITLRTELQTYNANDLRTLLAMWPALVELRIAVRDYDEDPDNDIRPPFDVLPELAGAFPALRVLHLPRTVLVPGTLDAARRAGVAPHRSLYDLRIGLVVVRGRRDDSRDEEAKREVRTFLNALFPMAGHRVKVETNPAV
ncbi:uncharacterized protein BXZ73DRAFT_106390 [Epithele typhae]|uniref:uncharacterized protein n=1 Tax=Epithele typhae TaxID=378194 RepID=UPI0020077DF4|nr:uncharacterized protein BXZ73DRAFT_106390 [Epithele typhae]KAH9914883.1 hypothetical protein BXZ73DRAFT_106390 [Epithele typhae]